MTMRPLSIPAFSRLSPTVMRGLRCCRWPALIVGLAALALFMMSWRWGGTTDDSLMYFNTARYLRGEAPASVLAEPFSYRLLIPAIASIMPGDLRNGFATLNWLAVTGGACMIVLTAVRLGLGRARAVLAGLMLVVSVPTFWYAPYLVVDPGSVCARAGFVLAVVSGQPWIAAAVGILATATREENILLLVWLIAARHITLGAGLLALSSAASWLLVVRWWLIPGLPHYVWRPSLAAVLPWLTDFRTLASLATGAGVVLPLALIGLRHPLPELRPLRSLLLLMALPPLYAAMCVRVEGRAIWNLYPMLIPFAVSLGMKRPPATPRPAVT
jgi:hypothetical protein